MASSSDVVKPEVFDSANFKRWQAKTKLWLTDLRLFWIISNPPMFLLETDEITRREDANYSVLARLLAILFNRLFDVYVNFTNAKQLWDELNEKYSEGDNGNGSFITATYLNYKMVEGQLVMEQLHELQLHTYKGALVNELSAAINVEERARAGDGTEKAQVQAHQVEVKITGGFGELKFKNQPQNKL